MTRQKLAESLRADIEDLLYALRTKSYWRSLLCTVLGSILFCVAVNGLLIPYKFLSGGITGVSLLLYYLLDGPSLGLVYWVINAPILFIAWRLMSLRYLVVCIFGVLTTSVLLDLTQGLKIPIHDPVLAAILAGILSGAGVGFYLRYGGSTGGMDIVATVMRRKLGIPMGISFISVNMAIVAINAVLNNIDIALYTGIFMFVHSTVIERVQAGFSQLKTAFIVTDKPEEVASKITKILGRGVTFLYAVGAYQNREKRVVYTVINMIELARLKELLYQIDPKAFVSISDASEVIGNRFLTWAEQGFEERHAHTKLHQKQVKIPA